ncbi:g3621 [Coccomyxa viridis]|uniref:G3621 protein n=1 Tax=Coccomyxa viridis TaxID=1274662 RepID=A0ABP1FN84_9CHLO
MHLHKAATRVTCCTCAHVVLPHCCRAPDAAMSRITSPPEGHSGCPNRSKLSSPDTVATASSKRTFRLRPFVFIKSSLRFGSCWGPGKPSSSVQSVMMMVLRGIAENKPPEPLTPRHVQQSHVVFVIILSQDACASNRTKRPSRARPEMMLWLILAPSASVR